MKKQFKWAGLAVATLVVVFLIVKYATASPAGTKVTAQPVKRRTIVETVSAAGRIYPENEVRITSDASGEITELLVQEGDSVRAGQVLARMNSRSPFFLQGQGSQKLNITSPISGIVSMISVRKGERVVGTMQMAGTEIMRIADMSRFEVQVEVDENDILKVHPGDSAKITVEAYNNRRFSGTVRQISSVSRNNPLSMTGSDHTSYRVHITLDPASYAAISTNAKGGFIFRPGMNADAEITTDTHAGVLSVPISAVAARTPGDSTGRTGKSDAQDDEPVSATLEEVVFVITGSNTAERRTVKTGIQDLRYFEILEGLREGEQVITGPAEEVTRKLEQGQKVRIVSPDKLF
ncbi:MAG TPA: efflux RND transporter periplasmic adaptor subunit [Flavisolibacter sp.]